MATKDKALKVGDRLSGKSESRSDNQIVKAFIGQLEDGDEQVRSGAALQLGLSQDPQAVPTLIKALEDKAWRVRNGAALGLGLLRDRRAVPTLIKALKDKDDCVRTQAVKSLLWIGDEQAVPALLWVLKKGKHGDIRSEAVEALAKIGGLQAVPILIEALKDKEERVSWQAATSLIEIVQHQPDPALRAALLPLRRLLARDPVFREAWEQIEAATGVLQYLPLPATPPPLDIQALPRPADVAPSASSPLSPERRQERT